jgi:hypothetical protein
MKPFTLPPVVIAVGCLLLGGVAGAQLPVQSTNAPTAAPPTTQSYAPPPSNVTNLVEAADDATRLPPPTKAPAMEKPSPVPLTPTRYGGLFGQALESEQPWQLLNPLAPPEYGDGTQNLSVNPVTGRAEGLTLFSIQLKPKPGAKKNSRRAASPER